MLLLFWYVFVSLLVISSDICSVDSLRIMAMMAYALWLHKALTQ